MLSSLRTASFLRLSLIAVAASLAACNDDDALRGGDDHDHTESGGRLAFATAEGDPQLLVHDLNSGQTTAIALSNAPTAVYASPEGRYAVVVQSGAGQVNFVDGGIWLHDDHAHADEPELLDFTLFGAKPAHYQTHEEQAALFYDGEAARQRSSRSSRTKVWPMVACWRRRRSRPPCTASPNRATATCWPSTTPPRKRLPAHRAVP